MDAKKSGPGTPPTPLFYTNRRRFRDKEADLDGTKPAADRGACRIEARIFLPTPEEVKKFSGGPAG